MPTRISRDIVYCFWLLHSSQELDEDFQYLVLPDGCIDIIFDISKRPGFTGALIMSSETTATPLNLGTSFSYVGIRMQPGAWLQIPLKNMGDSLHCPIMGMHDLEHLQQQLMRSEDQKNFKVLEDLVLALHEESIIEENIFVKHLLQRPIGTVEDLVSISGYSRRHVQRLIRETVGYSPHEFLRIIRFQKTLITMKAEGFADQAHFIRDFKRITGMTPGKFKEAYLF